MLCACLTLACALTCPRLRWRPPGREPHILRGEGDWQGCRTVEGQPGPTPAGSEQKPSPCPVARAQLEGQRVPSQSSGCLNEYPAVTIVEWEAQFSESFPWHQAKFLLELLAFRHICRCDRLQMLCTSWVQSYVCTYIHTYVPLWSNALNKNAPMFCHLQRQFDIQNPHCLSGSNSTQLLHTNIQWHKIPAPLSDKLSNRIQWPTADEAHTFDTIALLSIFLCVEAASKSVSRLVPTDSGRRFWAMKPLPSVRDAHTEHGLAKQWKRLLFKRSVTVSCTRRYLGQILHGPFWPEWHHGYAVIVLGTGNCLYVCIYVYIRTGILVNKNFH